MKRRKHDQSWLPREGRRVTAGDFSTDIREDVAGRFYVYQRDGAQYRHSMSYPSMEALYEAIATDIGSIQWLPWQPVR